MKISGKNNKILVFDKNTFTQISDDIRGLVISITGENNLIKIGCPEILAGLSIEITGNNNTVDLGKVTLLEDTYYIRQTVILIMTDFACVKIGDNPAINCHCFFTCFEKHNRIEIGNNVRFAEWVTIYASDAHAIIDIKSGKLLNKATKPVIVGNYSWCGYRAFLTKNAQLPDYTIVAAQSTVTHTFTKKYTIIAGNPAKVIKSGVRHLPMRPDVYLNKKD